MTIQELVDLHNGRTYNTEHLGTIELELKKSWSKAKIEELIEDFDKQIARSKEYGAWKSAVKSLLENSYGYKVKDISGMLIDWSQGTSVEEAAKKMFRQLRRMNTEAQRGTMDKLGWNEGKFTHIYAEENGNRILKDCRSGKAVWITPDGGWYPSSARNDWDKLRFIGIQLKHRLSPSTVVLAHGSWEYLNVHVYPFSEDANPQWIKAMEAMLTYSTKDDNFEAWGKLEKAKQEELTINSSTHRGSIELITRLHEAERLMLAIAHDFDAFLLNPMEFFALYK